ncbi:hypothetical protein POCGH01_00237100 [Plasmodium ovale]|uniref:Uncharacterized protein n=2 Tax=Plasmodium ovale TaxID=36330 RepID=A0A1A8X4R1_PLAOA|nr:hypothetical protein POVCU1_053680 [Plasmodium ovale curtisi]SBT84892.1 hypothetical protein POCGH01_00237100 [Plasmodium ovale]
MHEEATHKNRTFEHERSINSSQNNIHDVLHSDYTNPVSKDHADISISNGHPYTFLVTSPDTIDPGMPNSGIVQTAFSLQIVQVARFLSTGISPQKFAQN